MYDSVADVGDAQARFDERIRTAYQFGPAGALEALLGADSLAELSTIGVYNERALALDGSELRASVVA